ncbi:MAG: hypothetical protein WBW92_11685 [Rhodanobacteraceae bacterium]
MQKHWDFFKESDSSFGLFYPLHYVVAGFDTLDHAMQAEQALHDAGFAEDDVTSASGDFVANRVESPENPSWLDDIKAEIGRAIGTEANYIDEDLELARRGGAFAFAYVPTHERMVEASDVLKRHHPVYARAYNHAGVVHLIQPTQASNANSI